jgi:branched-chain amino acid transport system ATP-binding protein
MLLEIDGIDVHYGKVAALKNVSMQVPVGGVVTIIGANGAGKSTTLRAISGLTPISRGEIRFDGHRIDHLPTEKDRRPRHRPCAGGPPRVPDLTVEENLRTGAFLRRDKPAVARDLDAVYGRFPAAQGAPPPVGQDAVGRRAADAGDRPGADVAPRACCCSTSRRWACRR